DETAAILFTSGSTGIPKGAVYTHHIFLSQVDLLGKALNIQPGEVDLCTFPLFALYAPALGMTAVIPRMNFTRPAQVDPREIWNPVAQFGVTNLFGSPALIRRLAIASKSAGQSFPTLKRTVSAGAPVSPRILEMFQPLLSPGVPIFTPYGATESLPVAITSSLEILGETQQKTSQGAGICVGRVVEGMRAEVIRLTDKPIAAWSQDLVVLPGVIGEIAVCGPVVTKSYDARPEQTALAKIVDPHTGETWHRMGDVGYSDEQGRLWFCGRKSQRVELPEVAGVPPQILFADQCEAVFNSHPEVARTALVGAKVQGRVVPVLCVERLPGGKLPFAELEEQLRSLAIGTRVTAAIEHFLEHPRFPVDTRHNSKIFREQLAPWATKKLAR
ncbi:MAG: peptide synthase, partial [Planctomyces sp.]|nr:peptide synthase [Planctomyces sp.]